MNINSTISSIPILFEDEHMIILNKPANMRSVPGLESHLLAHSKPRTAEWSDAVKIVATNCDTKSDLYKSTINSLAALKDLPRKLDKFLSFLKRRFKIEDEEFIKSMHNDILAVDNKNHKTDFENIPRELMNAVAIAEKMTGSFSLQHLNISNLQQLTRPCSGGSIFIVHRLDMETSGVIVFGKTQSAAQELGRQFRDREVCGALL
jgi:hypothetical protein